MRPPKGRKPLFERLKTGLEEAILHAKGEITLKTTILEMPDRPPEVGAEELTSLRLESGMSQAVFARLLNVSTKTVQSWTPQVRALRRARASYNTPQELFLNRQGQRVATARMTAVFATAFRAAGVQASLHWLRHTFAMTMLVRLQQQASITPDLNPLKIVQVLLGHSSIQSTAVYLRCVELHRRELSDSIDYLYGELVPDAQ